jgi:cell wall-associated NlpC family hydrolase
MRIRIQFIFIAALSMMLFFSSCSVRRKVSKSNEHHRNELNELDVSKRLNNEIKKWLGIPYKSGGTDTKGIDCSALTCALYQQVYAKVLPRTCQLQSEFCKKISKQHLVEGDLVFFKTGAQEVSHVGLYLGDHQFVHASVSKGVVISSLENPYYKQRFVSGGRISGR